VLLRELSGAQVWSGLAQDALLTVSVVRLLKAHLLADFLNPRW